MPLPLLIGAGIAVGSALGRFISNRSREKKLQRAFNEAQRTRPEYEIPDALTSGYETAKREFAYGEAPGYTTSVNRNAMSAANALAAAKESGNVLAAIPAVQAQENRGFQDLITRNAEYKQGNLQNVLRMSQAMAEAEDTKWQMNEYAPWADKYAFKREMAGLKNQRWNTLMGQFGSLGTTIASSGGSATQNFFGGGGENVNPGEYFKQ